MNNNINIEDLVDQALEDGGTFEYADTLPALQANVKAWIEDYLDDNEIDYKLTADDIELMDSIIEDFYKDNVDDWAYEEDEYEDEEDDDDYDEDYMDESFRVIPARKNTIEEAFKLLRTSKKKINEDTKKFEDKDAEEEYFRHIQELSTDYEDPDAEEYEEDDYDEEDESLNEDAKFVTAATILKKEQAAIFAQPTEEGMRKMVLSILDKNKDKMKPENYNTVVKTMTNCPKRAVPSTVWTMLNPSQKVGK